MANRKSETDSPNPELLRDESAKRHSEQALRESEARYVAGSAGTQQD
jgi:hypothetical protein